MKPYKINLFNCRELVLNIFVVLTNISFLFWAIFEGSEIEPFCYLSSFLSILLCIFSELLFRFIDMIRMILNFCSEIKKNQKSSKIPKFHIRNPSRNATSKPSKNSKASNVPSKKKLSLKKGNYMNPETSKNDFDILSDSNINKKGIANHTILNEEIKQDKRTHTFGNIEYFNEYQMQIKEDENEYVEDVINDHSVLESKLSYVDELSPPIKKNQLGISKLYEEKIVNRNSSSFYLPNDIEQLNYNLTKDFSEIEIKYPKSKGKGSSKVNANIENFFYPNPHEIISLPNQLNYNNEMNMSPNIQFKNEAKLSKNREQKLTNQLYSQKNKDL